MSQEPELTVVETLIKERDAALKKVHDYRNIIMGLEMTLETLLRSIRKKITAVEGPEDR